MGNSMSMKIKALSKNEAFCRSVVAAFCVELNPTIDEINDIKTAVSEAVTNCIVHGYRDSEGYIVLNCEIEGETLHIDIVDKGAGIENIEKAMQPFYTTLESEERSGMGFTVMESFMDKLTVKNNEDGGLTVSMCKKIKSAVEV